MDANTRTLQIGYMLEKPIEVDNEMIEWTCDADERMCYVCMEQLDKEEENHEK